MPPDLTPPPAVAAAPRDASYWCADGRRVIAGYRTSDMVMRLERSSPLVLARVSRDTWRSDAYAGGPLIVRRVGEAIVLTSPGWPDTRCLP